MKPTSLIPAKHARLVTAVVASLAAMACNTEPTAPAGKEAFAVRNIAVYDGTWKDPQFGVSDDAEGTGAVNSMKSSPHNRNWILVAGDYDHIHGAGQPTGISAGLTLFYLTGGFRALAEGQDVPFYLGGPYNAVESDPSLETNFVGGSSAEASNLDQGLLGPAAMFDDHSRLWHELHAGTFAGNVMSLERAGDVLYVGGSFLRPFGLTNSANIFRFHFSNRAIESMGSGLVGTTSDLIRTIEPVDGGAIVGGSFSSIGGASARNIARWSESGGEGTRVWHSLGAGLNGTVNDILADGTVVYAAGRFYTDETHWGICARFDGTSWTILGPTYAYDGQMETQSVGLSLAKYKGNLILGGRFAKIGDTSMHNIAQWDASMNAWIALEGGGVDLTAAVSATAPGGETSGGSAEVRTMVVVGERLYVGGRFDRARVQ